MKNSDNKVNKEKQVSRVGDGEEEDGGEIGGGGDKGKKKRWKRMRGGVAGEEEKADK